MKKILRIINYLKSPVRFFFFVIFEKIRKGNGSRLFSLNIYRSFAKTINARKYKKQLRYRDVIFPNFLSQMSEKHDFENQSDHQFLYENGYYIDSSQKVKKLERLLVECEKLFIKNGKKDVDIMPYPVASLDVLQKNEIIMDFIFSEEIMYNVSRYLDGFPTLVSVDLLRSDPRKNTQEKRFKGSQNWHLDNVTRPFLRVFVYVNDVDNTAGPFSIVSKKLTQRI